MERETRKRRTENSDDDSVQLIPSHEMDDNYKGDNGRHFGGDGKNIALLLILYILQGIPLGLAGSIPLVLQNRSISYKEQAIFSFVHWPFSLKLLWAPVVDSTYWSKFGRRKSWLIPTQYLIAFFMLILSRFASYLLGDDDSATHPNVFFLTAIFFALNFLAATQDIAVDGWALTMLSRRNVGYASTCNSVGQTTGYFLGNVVFLALESADFCNFYLRQEPHKDGIVTLSGFLFFWGMVFLITTTLIMLLKKEKRQTSRMPENDESIGLAEAYNMLYRILCLPSIRILVALLFTCKIGFSATDAVTGLKLIEAGVHRENLALLAIPLVPLQILLPLAISRYTAGPKPLNVFLKAYPYRLWLGTLLCATVYFTYLVKSPEETFPFYYYIIIVLIYAVHQVTVYSVFVALMAFFAKISDPTIGGTYMTLLNTVCNLGGNWPNTVALWFVDPLTFKKCEIPSIKCTNSTISEIKGCQGTDPLCITTLDGYYIECVVCLAFGFLWLYRCRNIIYNLQLLPPSSWKCVS